MMVLFSAGAPGGASCHFSITTEAQVVRDTGGPLVIFGFAVDRLMVV